MLLLLRSLAKLPLTPFAALEGKRFSFSLSKFYHDFEFGQGWLSVLKRGEKRNAAALLLARALAFSKASGQEAPH